MGKDRRALAAAGRIAILILAVFLAGNAAGIGADDPAGIRVLAEERTAENVSYRVKLTSQNGADVSKLTDSDPVSKVNFGENDILTAKISEDAGFKLAGVYAIWDGIPGEWSIETGGAVIGCGQYGFIHEYTGFPSPVTALTLHIPAGSILCDLVFYTEGVLPASVQVWLPPWEQADLLLFPTHGDDEHLFFGGIMPYYGGELGYRVQVAYMTDHAFTEMYRVHEQLDGLWTVGIRAYPVFGGFIDRYSKTYDAAAEMYGEDNVERWQVEMIRRFRPYVIVGHDFEGEYGHGAHRLNGSMLKKSVPDAADPAKYPDSAEKYGIWDTQKFYSHLYDRDNGVIIEWGNISLTNFGGISALEMAKKGYLCHKSQQYTSFRVMTDGYGDCRQFGLYRSTVGVDVAKNDLLENVIFAHASTPEPTEAPTEAPTPAPTDAPTGVPASAPAEAPTGAPSSAPTEAPTEATAIASTVPSVPSDSGTAASSASRSRFIFLLIIPLLAALILPAVLLTRHKRKA